MKDPVKLAKTDPEILRRMGELMQVENPIIVAVIPNKRETFLSKMTQEQWDTYDERTMDLSVSQKE